MVDGDHAWVMALRPWSPSSTYQQLLTVWWVPQQLLQMAVFDTFTFEWGWGGTKNPSLGQNQYLYDSDDEESD